MAEQQTAPEVATEATDAAGTESATELRDTLVAKLKENRAAREGEGEPAKPKPKVEKPKRGERDPKPENSADPDAADAADSPEVAKHKAERRQFAKAKRKYEAQAAARETQIRDFEARAQAQIAAFDKDPIAWLKANKVDVRGALLRMANEDAEDPRDKKLRQLEEVQNRDKAEREQEKTEKAAREAKAEQAQAIQAVETELKEAWGKVDVDDYPTLAALLEPEHIAERAREIMIEHWRDHRKELAPSEVFATMEKELAPLKGKLANGKKSPKPPEQVRSASGKSREAESPEAPTRRERPSEDVTRRVTREQSLGRHQSFDKESIRERLVQKARGVMR